MSVRLFRYTFALVLPQSDLDGYEIEVTAASEVDALVEVGRKRDLVTKRAGLRLVDVVETKLRRSA